MYVRMYVCIAMYVHDYILEQILRYVAWTSIGHMDDDRLPKKLLFDELLKKQPFMVFRRDGGML